MKMAANGPESGTKWRERRLFDYADSKRDSRRKLDANGREAPAFVPFLGPRSGIGEIDTLHS
jgi:hypothetical protein